MTRLVSDASTHSGVVYFTWNEFNADTINDDVVTEIRKSLEEKIKHSQKSEAFSKENSGHKIILVKTLIEIFYALKWAELESYLGDLGINFLSGELKRYMFILKTLNVVSEVIYSDSMFYVCNDLKFSSVSLKGPERAVDSVRVLTDCREYYETNTKENHRKRALRDYFQGAP